LVRSLHVGLFFGAGAALEPMQAARAAQAAQAAARGRGAAGVVPAGAAPQELFRRPGRFHSRLHNVEYECWVHERALPPPARLQVRRAAGWARQGAGGAADGLWEVACMWCWVCSLCCQSCVLWHAVGGAR